MSYLCFFSALPLGYPFLMLNQPNKLTVIDYHLIYTLVIKTYLPIKNSHRDISQTCLTMYSFHVFS